MAWLAAAAAIAASVAAVLWWHGFRAESHQPLATITKSAAARWNDAADATGQEGRLPAVYHLLEGSAELTLGNGTVLTLEAPCRLELVNLQRALLHEGHVVAYVPKPSEGLTIETLNAEVRDLGTEFGMQVDSRTSTFVQVFDGTVVAGPKSPAGNAAAEHQVAAGKAVRIGKTVEEVPFSAERFVRWLPDPATHPSLRDTPYNRPSRDTLEVTRTRVPISVDGDLSEWDAAQFFESRCREPFGEHYHVRGALMYDDRHLYIAAVVGDPAPMRSILDPQWESCQGWQGGGVQLRLITDRKSGWPSDARRGSPLREQDVGDQLVHVMMWYFEPRSQPCLHIVRGMDFHGHQVNPPGYRGAFRKTPDGTGYVLEYALTWELLGAGADPPRGGDELPGMWTVHWSDAGGRCWRGKLTEICNLSGNNLDEFWRAESWGRISFLP